MGRYGAPASFNTDQGSQFTSWAWTQRLHEAGMRISMDGRGQFLDNVFIERLWRSMKYECIYPHAFSGGREARQGIGDGMIFYNHRRALIPRMAARRRSGYIEKGCRLPAGACARPSTRQSWWRNERDRKPDRQAWIVA